jgi:hypothetical protein
MIGRQKNFVDSDESEEMSQADVFVRKQTETPMVRVRICYFLEFLIVGSRYENKRIYCNWPDL